MLEMLMKPKRAERRPWEMFFVGMLYASLSVLIVSKFFIGDPILKDGSGLLIVLFTVMFSLPFMYYIIKLEEGKDVEINDSGKLIKEHSKAIRALIWLFLGFIIAFSFWYIVTPTNMGETFNYQIKAFCQINSPSDFNTCLESHGLSPKTGGVISNDYIISILVNNIKVLMFTLLFSLIFGAGAIFVLVWNATVIGAAIGNFAQNSIFNLPIGFLRYMIHGIPEIAAYFVGALAGGIFSVAVIRKDLRGERGWSILQDALFLIIISIILLVIAAFIEVYLTTSLF
tara:strand:- start:4052 stop:4906 length:855 start_codon:yes stop_codon:yes gene_type:complete